MTWPRVAKVQPEPAAAQPPPNLLGDFGAPAPAATVCLTL
jgi:hypothetical protein